MKLSDIKEFVTQHDGTIKAVTIQVTHELPNGGVVYSTEQHPIKANSVAIGDHADCWNWIGEVKL